MIYRFGDVALDRDKIELRRGRELVAVEPQVFALLLLLVENRERMVSRDEIIEKVWDGRIVSDSAIDSRVKSARKALGDDGKAQRFIRTVHGQGFRFVAELREEASVRPAEQGARESAILAPELAEPHTDTRPSIAVLPFRLIGSAGPYDTIADALPDELIGELSRSRWLFVIARGSSFRFRSQAPDLTEVGKALGARYCISGTVEISSAKLTVTVHLVDTRSDGVCGAIASPPL